MDYANLNVSLSFALTIGYEEFYREYTCTGGNRFKYGAEFGLYHKYRKFGFEDTYLIGDDGTPQYANDSYNMVVYKCVFY